MSSEHIFYHRRFLLEKSAKFHQGSAMTKETEKTATQGGKDKAKSDEKQARLAEALRANLRRRKEQARDRKSGD